MKKKDLAHDQEVYAWEGETGIGLDPFYSRYESFLYDTWNAGFDAGWKRATELRKNKHGFDGCCG